MLYCLLDVGAFFLRKCINRDFYKIWSLHFTHTEHTIKPCILYVYMFHGLYLICLYISWDAIYRRFKIWIWLWICLGVPASWGQILYKLRGSSCSSKFSVIWNRGLWSPLTEQNDLNHRDNNTTTNKMHSFSPLIVYLCECFFSSQESNRIPWEPLMLKKLEL